jgi:hypothetical protein
MIDFIYVIATIAFFGLMLLYVRACERIGRMSPDEGPTEDEHS